MTHIPLAVREEELVTSSTAVHVHVTSLYCLYQANGSCVLAVGKIKCACSEDFKMSIFIEFLSRNVVFWDHTDPTC